MIKIRTVEFNFTVLVIATMQLTYNMINLITIHVHAFQC